MRRLTPDVAVVVQARAGSTRLPGKVLERFGGSTLLGHVLTRIARLAGPQLWLATTTAPEDDAVAAAGAAAGAEVFRGSGEDVLGRFAACVAAMPRQPELVVRVCADRPFACPVLLAELLVVWEAVGRPAYLSNTLVKSYPDGLDLELVSPAALAEAAAEAHDPFEREHVTPFLYRRPERYRLVNLTCPYGNFAAIRATIDTPVDLERLRAVEERLAAASGAYEYRDVLTLATLDSGAFS